jgi:hypothetical protein
LFDLLVDLFLLHFHLLQAAVYAVRQPRYCVPDF